MAKRKVGTKRRNERKDKTLDLYIEYITSTEVVKLRGLIDDVVFDYCARTSNEDLSWKFTPGK